MTADPGKYPAILEKMRELRNKNMELSHCLNATSELHSAAVMRGDNKAADGYRNEIHALTDVILDNTASVIMLSKSI